jgi:tetratricopeptide (TPR) repeat protein
MRKQHVLIIAICIVAVIVAAVWWWQGRDREAAPAGPGDNGGLAADSSPGEADSLLQRLNVGVGHLENDQLEAAVRGFTQLAEEIPGEVAAVRNLLIARVLNLAKLEAASPDRPTAIEQARATLQQLQALQPDAVATHVLAARLAAAEENTTAALQQLQQATATDPQDLPAWYEQYALARYSTDLEIRQQGDAALARAFELAPTNLVVLLDRLQAQVDAQDADIVQTLQAGEPRWEQLAPGLQSRVRVDINELVAEAARAATDSEWPLVRRNVLIIKNVVTPEEATRSDRRQVERHALEFVVDRLSEPLMTQAAQFRSEAGSVATPGFAPADDAAQLPAEEPVVAVVAADFNLDGVADVALLHADRLDIHRRDEQSWSLLLSHPLTQSMDGMIAIDLDDDVRRQAEAAGEGAASGHPECHQADLDFVLWGASGVVALQNVEAAPDAERTLQPIELPAELAGLQNVRQVIPGDLDMDGDLDLLVLTESGLQLWANLGDLQFDASVLRVAGLPEQAVFTAALPIDWDDDIDLDVVLADDAGRLSLLESLRHGEFQWRDLGIDTGMSVSAIEPLDRDGAWDLLLAGDGGLQRVSSTRPVDGRVEVRGPQTLVETPLSALHLADLNNDGPLDVVGLAAEGLVVLAGQSDTTLSATGQQVTPGPQAGSLNHLAVADIDGDGRLDLLAATESGVRVLSNTTSPTGEWVDVSVVAEQIKGGDLSASGRVNHYGIGSLLELRSGAHRQRQIIRGPVVHFGLGPQGKADTVRVLWTNGVPENVIEPPPQTFICERQTLKGSCPYLYAWNGEEFAFVTDLLWAAPIGLTDASGAVVPPRAWEHLIIRPDQLAAREGKYELRLTEELWEAAYFDSVQLTAVDHPEGVEVVTNEKVGPPALAEHRLHTISQRRLPVSAVDQRGRDVLDLVREADEQYAKLFDFKLRQGYTEPTTLELDLGDLSGAERITLFLTGWIYPTDTTINVALAQNSSLDGPQPLSLAVPDAHGQWQTVLPFTGFPGGKTKTIAIDLSGVFLTGDYRVRLSTSQELYWDAICFTVDEPPVELRETPLPLLRAQLRSRGVSEPIVHPQHGPERYDYNRVLPSPWRPMDGAFTRLGDVRELLTQDDSRLVVMGSGDEVVLEFEAPPPPPDGWVRSFVIRNVGWDKDADLHTIYGQTVEPLPLVHMSRYPPPTDEMPTDPQYEEYLRQYQTRRMR